MRRSLRLATLKNASTVSADEDAISSATSSVKDDRFVDPSSSNFKRRREEEEEEDSTSSVKRQKIESTTESITVNGIHVLKVTHTEMMEDSPFYKALFEGGETFIYVNEISSTMLKTYIDMFENKNMLKKFLFSDTRGYYEFIEFLDRISSKSLFTVIDVWAQEIHYDGNKKVFMALKNYQNEQQKEETVLSLLEKEYLEKDFSYQKKSSSLTPISYCFDDNVYIMLKVKVFQYTVLTSMNARWLYIHGSRIVRLESVTKLERAVLSLEMSEGCCVKWVDFSKEDNLDDDFNLRNANIHYKVEGHQENEEDSDVDDVSSYFTNVSEDFDRDRVDGGRNFYYEGGMNFDGIRGVVQHGRGEMVEYPIDERNRPQEVNRIGIYINNKIYCDIVYCYRSSKCICQCRRKVGEASSGDSDNEESDDEDEEDDGSNDYDRCAFHIHKKEIYTNMESDSEMSLQYCQPCAEKSKTFQDEEYLGRLFHAITDVTFSEEHSDMMTLLERMNPHTSLVRDIGTFEDYVQLVKPSEQIIRHWDDRLAEQIRLIKNI